LISAALGICVYRDDHDIGRLGRRVLR
jgi:hypothetical protein